MVYRWLLPLLFILQPLFSVAQIVPTFVENSSHREVTPGTDGCATPPLCDFYKMVSWNDAQIGQAAYQGRQGTANGPIVEFMNWRMVFPLNYDPERPEPYPMIVMLHGAGESGRLWSGRYNYATDDVRFDNNGANIIHGGQAHLNAVNRNPNLSNAFPGIVIWPQVSYNGAWESGWENGNLSQNGRMVASIIEYLITTKNIDPDRIYMHGLSNGGKGTWDLAAKRPDLFAAVLPMAGVGSNPAAMAPILNTMPLWLFQGGTDTNPNPQAAAESIAALQAQGGDPRYTLYPTLGHGVWNTAYAEADFFPWILAQNKKNIHVFGGDPNICPGGSVKLGFSANMLSYQWTRDGVDINGANTREYTATITGTYRMKYKRRFGPDVWIESNPVVVGEKEESTFVPTLSNTGSTILTIDQPGVDNRINFTAPPGFSQYYWLRNGVQVASGTSNTRQISSGTGASTDAGVYTVKVLEGTGCVSAASNAIQVFWNSTQPNSPRPVQPTMTAISSTELNISWTDYSGEIGYELWRIRFGLGGYSFQPWTLVKVLPANTTSFIDTGLRPEATYRYVIRAILPSGQGIFSLEPFVNGVPLPDQIPPTSPSNLIASNISDTQITLTWDPSTDNDRVYRYEVYNGSTLLTTLTGGAEANTPPANTVTLNGLITGSTYILSVRALDYRNNYSPFAESIVVNTLSPQNGLAYKYYEFSGTMVGGSGNNQLLEPNGAFNFNQTPVATGNVSTFSIAPRLRNDQFVFAFDGYIDIPSAGNYWFYTSSDDGSRLYINGSLLVNNDGAHGTQERSNNVSPYNGVVIPLNAGKIPIRVTFFEQGGGETLTVSWQKTGSGSFSKQTIPANRLYLTGATISNYYCKSTGDLNDLSTWGTNTDGSGSSPVNFTTALNYFHIRNRTDVDLNNDWVVSGNGSKVIVGDGVNPVVFDINAALSAKVDANNNTSINVNHITIPEFGVLHAGSTVNFNGTGTVSIPNALYGNVTLAGSAQYNLPLNNTIIQGDLVVENGVTTSGVANNLTTLRIGGNLIVNNASGNPFPANGPNQYSLIFTGGTNHNVSFANPVNPNLFSIQTDFGDVVQFTNLSGNTFTVGSSQGGGLVLKGGSILDIGNNHLTINGRGTINANNETGSLVMNGGNLSLTTTATQNNNLYFGAGSNVNNLTSSTPTNNRLSLGTSLTVNNLVNVTSGELNAGEGFLILRSTSDGAGGTARIGPLLNGAKVSGKINFRRAMSGEGRIYRYISSPVKGLTVEKLQEHFPVTGNFTGASTGTGIISGNASMFHYVEPDYQQFPPVGGTNLDTLRRGKGYVPFIREGSAATMWEVVGEPHQGTIPFDLTGSAGGTDEGWNLLGNPYASPIKWTGNSTGGWTLTGVGNTVYVRENFNNTFIWRTHNGTDGTFDGVIAPGQAFWVRTTSANPQLLIAENAKHLMDGAFYREGEPNNVLKVSMRSASAEDATFIQFSEAATPAFDTNLDGVKQNNSFFNLSSLTTDGKAMAINLTTTDFCEQEVPLRITGAANGTYELEISGVDNLLSGEKVTLIDNYLNTEIEIEETSTIAFSITTEAASKADGRFVLRFEKPEVRLDMALESFAACEQNSPVIRITNAQPGVEYTAFHNGSAISEGIVAIENVLDIPVNPELISYGSTQASLKAGFRSCNSFDVPQTIMVHRDTLTLPEVSSYNNQVIASTENAQYVWYFEGEELLEENGRIIENPLNGEYQVEVTLGSCTKLSDPYIFVITSLETRVNENQPHPNPTKDKVVVTLEQPIALHTVRTVTVLGQVVQAPATPVTEQSIEVNLSELPAGLYFLYVNERRYRIIKE